MLGGTFRWNSRAGDKSVNWGADIINEILFVGFYWYFTGMGKNNWYFIKCLNLIFISNKTCISKIHLSLPSPFQFLKISTKASSACVSSRYTTWTSDPSSLTAQTNGSKKYLLEMFFLLSTFVACQHLIGMTCVFLRDICRC